MGSIQSTARLAIGVSVSSCTDVGEHAPSNRRPPPDQVGLGYVAVGDVCLKQQAQA